MSQKVIVGSTKEISRLTLSIGPIWIKKLVV